MGVLNNPDNIAIPSRVKAYGNAQCSSEQHVSNFLLLTKIQHNCPFVNVFADFYIGLMFNILINIR